MPVWPGAAAFGLFGKFIPNFKPAVLASQVESGVRGYRQCSMDFESTRWRLTVRPLYPPQPLPRREGRGKIWWTPYPGRRLEDSPCHWAIVSSSFQDFGLRFAWVDLGTASGGENGFPSYFWPHFSDSHH